MDDEATSDNGEQAAAAGKKSNRIFLVVVDESEEMKHALRFACRRAKNTGGRVALLHVIEPSDFQHWMAVGDLMREEARAEAEQLLQKLATGVNEMAGSMPVLYVREGDRRDELFKLLDEEPQVSILVLGAKTGSGGPGPLVSALTGKYLGKLRVPITLVPDILDEETIDSIS